MSEPTLIALGATIRRLRLQKELSQEELAEQTEMHRTYIGGVERGERNISILNLVRIARALDTSVAELVRVLNNA